AGDGDLGVGVDDVEDPARIVAADCQLGRPWPEDVQALVDDQLAARQRDGVAYQGGGKGDRVPVVGGGDRGPQRACPAVGVVDDGERARHAPILKELQPESAAPRSVLFRRWAAGITTGPRGTEPGCE